MSTVVWTPESGWHDGATASLSLDTVGRIRSSVLTLEGVAFRLDSDSIIGWMSDWGALYELDWISRGLVESIAHNSGGLGGADYRLTTAGKAVAR